MRRASCFLSPSLSSGSSSQSSYLLQPTKMLSMSPSKEAGIEGDPNFKWGRKRGLGGPKNEVQFYESFVYDGVEYFLYDCVYLYKEGEPEPYIGKLIKIWALPNHKKKIKVQWFFRPIEILNWLRDEVLKNEIFLASGEGVGLDNINPLEVLVGKCNVVCTSKDQRNPQPSEEDLKAAEYIFFRTFDVKNYCINSCVRDKVGALEARYVFNREGALKPSSKLKETKRYENELSGTGIDSSLSTSLKVKSGGSFFNDEKSHAPNTVSEGKQNIHSSSIVQDEEKQGLVTNISRTFEKDQDASYLQSSTFISEEEQGKVSEKCKIRTNEDLPVLDFASSKKARIIDSTAKQVKGPEFALSQNSVLEKRKSNISVQKLKFDSIEKHGNDSEMHVNTFEKSEGKHLIGFVGKEKGSSSKTNDENKAKHLDDAAQAPSSSSNDNKTDGLILEISRRPDSDRSKWFGRLPWEERLRVAHDQGTLVLLQNLHPSYTSSEVEDIIWHVFKEKCTARVMQRTTNSSPFCGQSFVIFKSKEAAEKAVRRLYHQCLMLPDGRPLLGMKGIPVFPEKTSKFAGHLVIEKVQLQMQREETKQAVSTAHCSQPNTIECEMAMEWRLLQAKSDIWWKELYKQQDQGMSRLWKSLKTK